jgi:hypothetical protein
MFLTNVQEYLTDRGTGVNKITILLTWFFGVLSTKYTLENKKKTAKMTDAMR